MVSYTIYLQYTHAPLTRMISNIGATNSQITPLTLVDIQQLYVNICAGHAIHTVTLLPVTTVTIIISNLAQNKQTYYSSVPYWSSCTPSPMATKMIGTPVEKKRHQAIKIYTSCTDYDDIKTWEKLFYKTSSQSMTYKYQVVDHFK